MKSIIPADKDYLDSLSNVERKKHLQKVKLLKLLYAEGPKSNADICRIMNISSPTSLLILCELLQEGLVEKKGKGKSIGGRKPELYSLPDSSFYVLCIEIERFKTEVAILDNNNNFISTSRLPLPMANDERTISKLYQSANQLMSETGIDEDKLLGIGISTPGLIDKNTGKNYTYLFPSDDTRTLQDSLAEKFGKPVFIQNDVKTNALAELRFGLAANRKDVLVLLMDWGIGLGIIMDGKLQSGVSGFAGEIGHMPFVNDGELCYCGKRGCLETVASGIALARQAKQGIQSGESSLLNNLSDEEIEKIEPHLVIAAANKGDEYAASILSALGYNLGKAISTLIQLFNPELIILGGKIAEAKQYLTVPLRQSVNTYCMSRLTDRTEIVLSELGSNAGLLGSASIVMANIFEQQIGLAGQRSPTSSSYSTAF